MQNLDPDQQAVVDYDGEKNVVVVAGPGSGKTRTLIARIERLISTGVDPKQIAAITFTGAGAAEINSRLVHLGARIGYVGTLHGMMLRYLRKTNERLGVVPEEFAVETLESLAASMRIRVKTDDLLKARQAGVSSEGNSAECTRVLKAYYARLLSNDMIDYDGILSFGFRKLKDRQAMAYDDIPHAQIFVDEFQDSGEMDMEIYNQLNEISFDNGVTFIKRRLHFFGDPDQSIFGFRGAKVLNILNVAESKESQAFYLCNNYRSLPDIVYASGKMIQNNSIRLEELEPRPVRGATAGDAITVVLRATESEHNAGVICAARKAIDSGVAPEEVAVLCRTNWIAYGMREEFQAAGMSTRAMERIQPPKDWRLARAAIALMAQPRNWFLAQIVFKEQSGAMPSESLVGSWKAKFHFPMEVFRFDCEEARRETWDSGNLIFLLRSFGVCAETINYLAGWVTGKPDIKTAQDLLFSLNVDGVEVCVGEGVFVGTAHSSKGREWHTVIIAGAEEGSFPHGDTNGIEEERRLFYVAATRAKDRLYICGAMNRKIQYNPKFAKMEAREPSRFIAEMAGCESVYEIEAQPPALCVGLQLFTKDGRRFGNGIIIGCDADEEHGQLWTIETDFGSRANRLSAREVLEEWHTVRDGGQRITDPSIWRADRQDAIDRHVGK